MCCFIGKCVRRCSECICALLFSTAVVVLIYWAIFQPHHIRAAVDSATLSNLTVVGSPSSNASSSSPSVLYSLSVNLSLYNPSVRVGIYYDAVDARLRFRDAVLGPANNATTSEFYQRRKSGDVVKLGFDASRGVGVAGDVAGELEKEVTAAAVRLELDVDVRVRYAFRIFKLRQKPRVRCWLSIPVQAEGRRGVGGVLAPGDPCRVKY